MWSKILNWILDFMASIEDYAQLLFTPINIQVASKMNDFHNEMLDKGLTNFPTWGYDLVNNVTKNIDVTPIEILGVGLITIIFVTAVYKLFFS